MAEEDAAARRNRVFKGSNHSGTSRPARSVSTIAAAGGIQFQAIERTAAQAVAPYAQCDARPAILTWFAVTGVVLTLIYLPLRICHLLIFGLLSLWER